jgi:CelD/BcsL family acetyltransferase involved in cellulose biosynthesis
VETLTTLSKVEGLIPEWEKLSAHTVLRLPFSTPDWNLLWWKYFAQSRPLMKDTLCVRSFRDAQGELVGVAPMLMSARPAQGPLRLKVLQFFGVDPYVTEIRGVVCKAGLEGEIYAALQADLAKREQQWDWVQWAGVPQGGPGYRALSASPHLSWTREVPDFTLTMKPTWEEFKTGLSRNIKESLRKCYNSLKRDGIVHSLRVVESAEELPGAVERFFELHGARATLTDTVSHGNVFSTEHSKAFLRAYINAKVGAGGAKVFQLILKDQVVATRIGFVMGDTLYLYFSGYDPAWGQYSVMTTTVAEAIKYAIEKGLKTVNLSAGNDVSKTRWGPTEHTFREAVEVAPRLKSRVVQNAWDKLYAMRQSPDWQKSTLGKLVGRFGRNH